MNKLLTFILLGLLVIVLIEMGIIFIGGSSSMRVSFPPTITPAPISNLNNPTSNFQPPTSNSSLPPDFKILYQEPGDKEGRTIIYESLNHKFSGVGEFYDQSTSPARLTHIIGVFERWEEIPGSKDKYLILTDPISKKPLKKTRVAFEKSGLFDQGRNLTRLAFERLKDGELIAKKERVLQIDQKEWKELIKKGDVLVVQPLFVFDQNGRVMTTQKDNNKVELASWLYLRRIDWEKSNP